MRAVKVWLGEPDLIGNNLYVPSLPPRFLTVKLSSVIGQTKELWIDYLERNVIQENCKARAITWEEFNHRRKRYLDEDRKAKKNLANESSDPLDQMRRRLASYDPPKQITASKEIVSASVLKSFDAKRVDDKMVDEALKELGKHITDVAKHFVNNSLELGSLSCKYVELLPQLYANKDKHRPQCCLSRKNRA